MNTHGDAQEEYINKNNNLTTIPTEVPSNIQILNLEYNQLEQLLEGSLDQVTDLQEIYLESNVIETLEDNVFDPSIHQNLRIIYIGNNRITEMPVLHGFQMLRILDVSNNELQTITRKPVGFMQSCVNFNTAFDYLLMLTIFHVQKVLIILD